MKKVSVGGAEGNVVVTKRAWKVLGVTSLTNIAIGLDLSITNVAIPDMQSSFPSASTADLSWTLTFYMVVYAGFLIVSGRLADRFGRLRVLNIGFGIFIVSAVLTVIAPTVLTLIAARGLIGLSAAMVAPASLGLAVAAWPVERRGTAVTIWGSTLGLSSALGPIIGGLLIDAGSWRWAFSASIPIIVVTLLWGARTLTESERNPDASRPDLVGSVSVTVAAGGLALAIVQGREWGWGSPAVLGLLLLSIGAIAVLARRISHHPAPIVPRELLKVSSFKIAAIAVFIFSLGFFSALLTMVLYLVEIVEYSTSRAGLGVSALAFAAFTSSMFSGRIADRFGYRNVAVPGILLFVTGACWLYLRATSDITYFVDLFPGFILLGAGIGAGPALLVGAGVSEVDSTNFSVAGAVMQTARQLAGAIGIALVVTILGSNPTTASFRSVFLYLAGVTFLSALIASRLPSRK